MIKTKKKYILFSIVAIVLVFTIGLIWNYSKVKETLQLTPQEYKEKYK